MASERLQGEEQFNSKNYLSEMSSFHAKMHLKSAQQKLNFLMEKSISESCKLAANVAVAANALARSRIVAHSNAVSFLIKTILCENTNILLSKNY